MGAVGGGIWHFSKGMYHSPRGLSSRFAGGLSVRARALRGCAAASCRGVRGRCTCRPLAAAVAARNDNPRWPEDCSLRRRCASRRRAWAAASPCGAASSLPSTARWWLSAKRRAAALHAALHAAALVRAAPPPAGPGSRARPRAGGPLERHLLRRAHRRLLAGAPRLLCVAACRVAGRSPAAHLTRVSSLPAHRSCATGWLLQAAPLHLAACCWLALRA